MKQKVNLLRDLPSASPPAALDGQAAEQAQMQDPLLGAFPALASFSDEDFLWAKQLWNQSLEKQMRIIDGEIL